PFLLLFLFFLDDPSPTQFYTLSLHDALPISLSPVSDRSSYDRARRPRALPGRRPTSRRWQPTPPSIAWSWARFFARGISCAKKRDRKSTRLNSSHVSISYAVFCLKKKKNRNE